MVTGGQWLPHWTVQPQSICQAGMQRDEGPHRRSRGQAGVAGPAFFANSSRAQEGPGGREKKHNCHQKSLWSDVQLSFLPLCRRLASRTLKCLISRTLKISRTPGSPLRPQEISTCCLTACRSWKVTASRIFGFQVCLLVLN